MDGEPGFDFVFFSFSAFGGTSWTITGLVDRIFAVCLLWRRRNIPASSLHPLRVSVFGFGDFPMQNVKLNHYIAVFERVVLLCKICEQQTSNRIESLAIESGCIKLIR